MKKLVLLAVLAAGMMFTAKAQENSWGIRAGFNLSTAGGDFKDYLKKSESGDRKAKAGFNIGVIYDWGISENFYLQPGLYYTMKGVKAKDKGSETENGETYSWDYQTKINLSYLELPILASYRIKISDNVKWHINAGPYFAVGVGGKFKIEEKDSYDGETDSYKYDYDAFGTSDKDAGIDEDENGNITTKGVKGGLKRFDFGLSFGTGVDISKFYVGVKYDLGLTNIADKDQYTKYNDNGEKDGKYKIKNGNFSVSVGYNF